MAVAPGEARGKWTGVPSSLRPIILPGAEEPQREKAFVTLLPSSPRGEGGFGRRALFPLFQHLRRERLAVTPPEHAVGLGVAPTRLGLAVEVQRAAQAQGDVAQVTQTRALVPLLDVGVRAAAAADAVEEVAQV